MDELEEGDSIVEGGKTTKRNKGVFFSSFLGEKELKYGRKRNARYYTLINIFVSFIPFTALASHLES